MIMITMTMMMMMMMMTMMMMMIPRYFSLDVDEYVLSRTLFCFISITFKLLRDPAYTMGIGK